MHWLVYQVSQEIIIPKQLCDSLIDDKAKN